MKLSHLFSRSHRWAFALWLALLLPLAQAAAVRHEISHLGDKRGPRAELVVEHCELCLAAAALGGLAPPAQPAGLTLLAPRSEAVAAVPQASAAAPARLAYRSRAPPALTH